MKKVFFMMSLALMAVFMVSCSDENEDIIKDEALIESMPTAYDDIMEFSSEEDFQMLIEKGMAEGTRAGANYRIPSKFISLMDVISPTAEVLKDLSEEERNTILQNRMTYYEAFGYGDIIPNEDVAKMINVDGEVIVDNQLYRITDIATFTTAKEDAPKLEQYLCSVDQEELQTMISTSPEPRVQLTPQICAIRSYNNNIEQDCRLIDDRTIIGGGGSGPRTGNGSSGVANGGNDTTTENLLNQIPFASFETYPAESRSWLGRLFDGFNMRHNRHHEFKKDYRVTGSLYDYNYGFYRECGAYVSMDKKRGGFFRLINGWKDINANKLVLHVDHIVLETTINISNDILSTTPSSPINLGSSNNGTSVEICIFGKEWTFNNIEKILGNGLKDAIKKLKSATNSDIPDNTRSFLFVTPQKLYKVIYNQTSQADNKHKVRKVFSSGFSFVFSLNTSSLGKTLMETVNKTLKSPSYHIVTGQVKLAGKLDNNWGGMIIYK